MKGDKQMNRELLLLYLVMGIVLAGLEIYVVKSRKANKWIIPGAVWIITIAVAIPFSVNFGAFSSLLQAVVLVGFYIEDWLHRRNSDDEKFKIKNL